MSVDHDEFDMHRNEEEYFQDNSDDDLNDQDANGFSVACPLDETNDKLLMCEECKFNMKLNDAIKIHIEFNNEYF